MDIISNMTNVTKKCALIMILFTIISSDNQQTWYYEEAKRKINLISFGTW